MELPFKTLDSANVENKKVIIRLDLDMPYNPSAGKIEESDRFPKAAETVKELTENNAALVLIGHQGRKGQEDFVNLSQHAEILSKLVGKKIEFIEDIVGPKAVERVKSLKPGEIIMLDNVRFLEDETIEGTPEDRSSSTIVKTLAPLFDIFIYDAFCVSHRAQASLVGFNAVLPSYAGRQIEQEVKFFYEHLTNQKDIVLLLGGAKIEDNFKVLEHMLEKDENSVGAVLTTGLMANVFLSAKGIDIGKPTRDFLEKKKVLSLIPRAKALLLEYPDKMKIPEDIAIEENNKRSDYDVDDFPLEKMILDIGQKTIDSYCKIIQNAKAVIVKGPAGKYEQKEFAKGTQFLLNALRDSEAFSLIGGGHTIAAMKYLNFKKSDFSHVSLGGGALITFLSGGIMAGIDALIITNNSF